MNSDFTKAKISIVGISNDLKFTEFLDPRVKSSLGEENMIFDPYDAQQLQDILQQRADAALRPEALGESVIPLCAALAAQEHGDARRALDLLRISAEIAERDEANRITERHVKTAQNKIELDRVMEVTRTLPSQSKIILLSIILKEKSNKNAGLNGALTTGEVYDVYAALCKKARLDKLTQRRVADLISELDMLGIINARIISKGRYGRTREIQISASSTEIMKIFQEDDTVADLTKYKIKGQTRLI